jgi:lipopolysaccharide assembly protein A
MTKRRRELRELPTPEARCGIKIYFAIIILLAAALQNFEIVTMSLLGLNARAPLSLLIAIPYLLGTATGAARSLLRRSYEGSKRRMMASP